MPMNKLFQLHAEIDARVTTIRSAQPEWLCGKGCGHCCQRLAEIPQLTITEWAWLREGLAALSAQQLHEISQNMAALTVQTTRPVICPLLDRENQSCPVYLQRPVACRTYGFYVQRELGLYCQGIEAQVAAGTLDNVVWGNHDAIDHQLAGLGETRALTEWFAQWIKSGP